MKTRSDDLEKKEPIAPTSRGSLLRRTWRAGARHPVIMGTLLVVGASLIVFVLVYFQPQKLFLDQRVDERAPAGSDAAATLASGSFEGIAHTTSGRALILELADGSRVLRFEDLESENGPDLHVYLSTAPVGSPESSYNRDFVDLGKLEGNVGSQNYELPEDLDLSGFQSVVIWCKRFSVGFGVAPPAVTCLLRLATHHLPTFS